jgi:molybdate transport system permease protein
MLSSAESEALCLSLSVAARSVAFNLPFAILVAWLLTRTRFAGRTLFDVFVHLPLVLPPVVVGYLLLLLLGVRGPIGSWLHEFFGIQLAFTRTGAALATAVNRMETRWRRASPSFPCCSVSRASRCPRS